MDGNLGDVSAQNTAMSPTLVELATELGKYAPLVAIVSILGSYVYNTVFFHNIDGELYFQPFMSLLTLNDYISTSFHFIPPITLIFLFAIFMVQAVALVLWRSSHRANWSVRIQRWQHVWLLRWALGYQKRFGYLLSIILFLMPTGWASLTAETMQARYNWGIAFIVLTFMVLFFMRKDPKLFRQSQTRLLYVQAITTVAVVVMSATMGNYRFEMALNKSQKTLLAVGPTAGKATVTGARALEKGLFFIRQDEPGKPVAYFVMYEGGYELSNPVRPMRQGPLYRRVPCWLHLATCS